MGAWPVKAHPMDSETPGREDQMDGRLSAGPVQRVLGYDTHPYPSLWVPFSGPCLQPPEVPRSYQLRSQ